MECQIIVILIGEEMYDLFVFFNCFEMGLKITKSFDKKLICLIIIFAKSDF
jgi:hypothetical protein